uniref:Uncharacterized protein n=1 Tax=Glossina palpalis gambiensis TaxID=67801 RepID=A0A1B0AZI4_9MUSC
MEKRNFFLRNSGGLPRKKRDRQTGDWMNEENVDNVPLRPDGDTASPGQFRGLSESKDIYIVLHK